MVFMREWEGVGGAGRFLRKKVRTELCHTDHKKKKRPGPS